MPPHLPPSAAPPASRRRLQLFSASLRVLPAARTRTLWTSLRLRVITRPLSPPTVEQRQVPSQRWPQPWRGAKLTGTYTRHSPVAVRSVASSCPCPNLRRWLCLAWAQARSPGDCDERFEPCPETANAGSIEPAFLFS